MNVYMIKTCEFVTPKHPDKFCDFIVDSILDEYMMQDRESRVALEILGGHHAITISGEVTSTANVDATAIIRDIVGPDYEIRVKIEQQSPFIAQGVDTGGAGDQGIMMGYAFAESESLMPREYDLARELCRKVYTVYPYDGKVQVTVDGDRIICVVASFQNAPTPELTALVQSHILAEEYLINPAGEWTTGGFDADSGLSGRKIVIDNYGPEHGVGGGSFSGKDWTKVDRSGAYMARRIAVDYLKKRNAQAVEAKLAYAIGKKDPVMAIVTIDGKDEQIAGYDLSPRGMREYLKLDTVRFADTAQWGHFGNGFPWDDASA